MFRATKVAGYIRAMEARGISEKLLLAGTQIDAALISTSGYLISPEQYHALVANMIKLTDNQGIAFSFADLANLNDFGIVGYAMISARSLRDSLGVWLKYSSSLVGTPMQTDAFYDVPPGYEVIVSSRSTVGNFHRFETEEILVQGAKVIQDLTGLAPVFGKVSFSYPEPAHRPLYDKAFRCPLEFNAPQTVVRILKPSLDAPIRTMNEEMFSICAEHCRQVMRSLSGVGLLRSRLRSMFLATPGRLPNLEQVAASFGTSVSTLCRQLNGAGHSYQAIKDEFRFDLAREYLRTGHMPPKQVGYLLGFNSPSTFSRAFKGWSGKTVGEFLSSEAE